MDYTKLRAAALKDGEAEEAVTVDTRALIDKVLARYSGEWTTLRELIQNAADAQAKTVKIKWETLPSTTQPLPSSQNRSDLLKHTLKHHALRRLVVQNNGQPFTKMDWGRLKRIAEGNPDETKIGAFGVGFYSVFADCEEPFVSSGNEAMAFYWKGNALFTRKLVLPAEDASPDTAFVLDYRNSTTSVPNLLSISQFLATSLTFVALKCVEFWIDDFQILALHKNQAPRTDVVIPRDLHTRTRGGLMNLASVEKAHIQIDASFMLAIGWKRTIVSGLPTEGSGVAEVPSFRSLFSRLTSTASQAGLRGNVAREEAAFQQAISEDITALSKSSISLQVTTGLINTKVSTSFSAELERATKKPPPKTTKLAILTSSCDEMKASEDTAALSAFTKAADVFASVLPSKKPGGRIFIGFPTGQTTGAGMHISAPSVIPTVEREAIDLNARWVQTWNTEMLCVAGIMARLAFTNEIMDLDLKLKQLAETRAKGATPTKVEVLKLLPDALHILKTYTFQDSTPSANVGQIIEDSFWVANPRPSIELYSSRGVLQTTKVRMGSDELAKFVQGIPIVLDEMKEVPFVRKLQDFGLIQTISPDDIRSEFEAKALNKDQLVHFIAWAAKNSSTGDLDQIQRERLFEVAVAAIGEGETSGGIISLGSITTYLQSNKIPPALPIPPTTIPFAFTNQLPPHHVSALGWQPLEIVPWLRFLIDTASDRPDKENITKSAKFSVAVLTVLSKNWDNLSNLSKDSVTSALQSITIMPTKLGMRKPAESFFSSVRLFNDLPTIEGCQGIKEKFLVTLGVRKTLDLDTIFSRLLKSSGESAQKPWSHIELIKYLSSVRDDIPADDMKKLKHTPICPAEAGPVGMEPTQASAKLHKVSELFEPHSELRELGLPILQWPGPPGSFRTSSKEAKFLSGLGLRPHPSVPELIELMASSDVSRRDKARNYFIKYHQINGYNAFDIVATNQAILPLQDKPKQLVPPSACYTNDSASVLGFNILARNLHQHANKFGVAVDPPIDLCISRLVSKPPLDRAAAVPLFEYFAGRARELAGNGLSQLKSTLFVPVQSNGGSGENVKLAAPQYVYLGSSSIYGEIFDFVNFGDMAHSFLLRCGAKLEPTKQEIAHFACNEPARLWNTVQSSGKYMDILRSLASDLGNLIRDKDLYRKMKQEKWLMAFKEIPSSKAKSLEDDDCSESVRGAQLASPSEIVISDDFYSFRLFREHLLSAPEDEKLEAFYRSLGSPAISSLVQEDHNIGKLSTNQGGAVSLRKLIMERTKLFLHEYRSFSSDSIQHDVKWLEKNLNVEIVQRIQLRRSLRGTGHSHTEKRSAMAARSAAGYTLYIAAEQGKKPDLYQVGQAICSLILTRHNQQSYFFFEPFLKLDLLELRARGYNVDRILRAKEEEARVAEAGRREALEAEQQRIREYNAEWARQSMTDREAEIQPPDTPKQRMPGSLGDSPERPASLPPTNDINRRSRGLLSNIARRLGVNDKDELKRNADSEQPEVKPSQLESYSPQGPGDSGRVTSPAVVQNNLLQAIRSTRAHDSSNVFSQPETQQIQGQSTYCDSKPAQNIAYAAQAPRGMKVYLHKELTVDSMTFIGQNSEAITKFEVVLRDVADVYGVSPSAIQIHYDESGPCIAFNTNGSIFCNFRFFLQLHFNKMCDKLGHMRQEGRADAAVWWFVVVAHELAHNLVGPHDANHSYYTESFVQEYFGKMMIKVSSWSASPPQSSGLHQNSVIDQLPAYTER